MSDGSTIAQKCANCAKTRSSSAIALKYCAKCNTTQYCSRDCQKADWKVHKRICARNASNKYSVETHENPVPGTSNAAGTAPKGLSIDIDMPFHRLDDQTWLHDRPEQDVYTLLIDAYRLRMEDNYAIEGQADNDSIYGGKSDGLLGFRRFLGKAAKEKGLLPPWWSEEKVLKCEEAGNCTANVWSSLQRPIKKVDVVEHYGNPLMPMQLRMFAERVYGRGPGGQSGAPMRQAQMMLEKKQLTGINLDVSSMSG